jgi:hypothetical protein
MITVHSKSLVLKSSQLLYITAFIRRHCSSIDHSVSMLSHAVDFDPRERTCPQQILDGRLQLLLNSISNNQHAYFASVLAYLIPSHVATHG